ncbi:MAG: GDYXXLXY domain-containing protein [Acidobacteriota bacterium]
MTVRIAVFLTVAMLQLAVLGQMIWRHETTLRQGETYLFRVDPVDPIHLFRGRYLDLDVTPTTAPFDRPFHELSDTWVYVPLSTDDEGFATLGTVSATRPSDGDYLRARARWQVEDEIQLEMPFDRYYLREDLAKPAPGVLRDDRHRMWVEVKVKDGRAVPSAFLIDGRAVEDVIRESIKQPMTTP